MNDCLLSVLESIFVTDHIYMTFIWLQPGFSLGLIDCRDGSRKETQISRTKVQGHLCLLDQIAYSNDKIRNSLQNEFFILISVI